MDDESAAGNSLCAPCRYCGSNAEQQHFGAALNQAAIYQVIVACASCGTAFTALSRN
ncbi:MAG: hypothetical protein M3160_04115 [Candidatus Eremiobacteraeota bacterium]|nr:hypothetical protein [Candidatus Eremiobacteraeota bacterium]